MSREQWQQLGAARELLGLGERATIREVKQAYRRLSKKHHPDLAGHGEAEMAMHELTAAYQTLLRHCEQYPVPLCREESDQPLDGEDWWMDRFGQDPLWGKGGK
jgi:hypothetical protein